MRFESAIQSIRPLLKRIDRLSRRERLLVLITTLVVIGGIWQAMILEPLGHKADASRIELQSIRDRIESANRNLEEQILQLASANQVERVQIARLRERIEQVNGLLEKYAGELIDPADMTRVLEQLLLQQSRLQLVSIRNTEPERLVNDTSDVTTAFFKHSLEIEFEGSFADCLAYLDEVEQLPWRLHWQLLDVQTTEYPINRVKVVVSTMSLDEEWIGA